MALRYKVDESEFVELDETQQGFYRQEGNVFVLDVDGFQDNEALTLKAKVEQLLTEKKEAERKSREIEESARREVEEKAKSAGDFEQLYKSLSQKYESLESEYTGLQGEIKKGSVMNEATRIANSMTRDTARAKLLTEKLAARLSVTDDGIKVLDQSGSLTVSSLDELTHQIKTEYPFLVDGSQASGGAAQGSKAGGSDLKQVTRTEFDTMDQFARSEFVRTGGKISDD
jgi:hypothetical protein